MSLLEFTTKIEHGVIHLPKEFEDYENAVAHVTITLETPEDKKIKKENLLKAFKKAIAVTQFGASAPSTDTSCSVQGSPLSIPSGSGFQRPWTVQTWD